MTVRNSKFQINTRGFTDIIDITQKVKNEVYRYNLKDALVHVYVAGSTVSLTAIEFEPGLLKDFPAALEKIAPMAEEYHHDDTWHDGNGYAHVRAALIGNSFSVPLVDGALQLGTWQQIVIVDFDNKPRNRTITVQVLD